MSNDGVIAVERALSVLESFRPGHEHMTLAELAEQLPLHKTTIFRLLNSLVRKGFVSRGPDGRYSLGAKVLYLGRVYQRGFSLADMVTGVLTRLMQQSGETASYYVPHGETDRLCLFRAQPAEGLHSQVIAGTVLPPDDSSCGRIFRIWYNGEPPPTDTLPYFSSGKRDPFSSSWSMPLFGVEDRFAAALVVAGLTERIKAADGVAICGALMQASWNLSRRLGASDPWLAHVYGTVA
jgi:DNA-binding IclR family transcriptional regulator